MVRKFSVQRLAIRFVLLVLLAFVGLLGMSWSAETPDFPAESGSDSFAACPDSPKLCLDAIAVRYASDEATSLGRFIQSSSGSNQANDRV